MSTPASPNPVLYTAHATAFGGREGPVRMTAHVGIGPVGAGFGLTVALEASLLELPREQAEALVRAAHEVCPSSNATRGNVPVSLRVV